MIEWKKLENEVPEFKVPVVCQIQHWHTKGVKESVLWYVDESDHNWKVVDGNCELSHDWNVIGWRPLEAPVRNTDNLTLKPFDYIQVMPHDANIRELLAFGGYSGDDLEQELIYHMGGSEAMIGSIELCNIDYKYILKFSDGTYRMVDEMLFNMLFEQAVNLVPVAGGAK
ncbi:hypothetical protein QX249_12515 [Vibrio parahaemolyticus]|uniref:DUF4902 domain-containing protein n=1 Tax=Vibrio parahaemolyticus TaxID=670 RepID=A0AAW8PYY5_VIBPH|nr:hypothetical protein [Vibrio parahaemolyticus]EGR2227441.1 hypothetical protein [Vibrio parahaemolyticus]MDS1821487.1 hypothetical protein [Vibrio parahaemolyticus]